MAAEVTAELDRAYREERAKVLATLTRHLGGDLGLAEDAVQDVPRRHDQPGRSRWHTLTAPKPRSSSSPR